MAERLVHYSGTPLRRIVSSDQSRVPAMKPSGLWFSVEQSSVKDPMGWREWCEGEGYRLHALHVETQLRFRPDARILRLRSARDIDRFHAMYNAELIRAYRLIDWSRVAADYQAIIIAPYIWSRRLSDARWYYSWDCASGCVWDASAVDICEHPAAVPLPSPSDQPGGAG